MEGAIWGRQKRAGVVWFIEILQRAQSTPERIDDTRNNLPLNIHLHATEGKEPAQRVRCLPLERDAKW